MRDGGDAMGEDADEDGMPSSSSFPEPSPSFWDEAALMGTNVPAVKVPTTHPSPSPPHSEAGTTLTYLPNRTNPFLPSSHAYLASAEYAPNAFGDIGDYMRKKEIKIQTQNRDIALADPAAAALPQIFRGVSFHINGNTTPPMEELRKMILQRGGEVRPVLRSKGMVDYIIAPMLTQMKFKLFKNYRVVREEWILRCCEQGRFLDWSRWKLTVKGGWEEEGRKGLEGFLKPTQGTQGTQAQTGATLGSSGSRLDKEETTLSLGTKDVEATAMGPPSKPAERMSRSPSPVPVVAVDAGQGGEANEGGSGNEDEMAVDLPRSPELKSGEREVSSLPSHATVESGPLPRTPAPAGVETTTTTPTKTRPEGAFEFYSTKESNDDAARMLKDQEWRLRNTAERGNEGGFIDGYYQNSRLHHLSTWKAELRVLVAAAQRQSEEDALKAPSSTGISSLSLSSAALPRAAPGAVPTPATGIGSDKVILHVDFDCFFVSCGLATRPHLKGKPVVVCHSTGGRMEGSTSEIASASYEARDKGVRNGMSLGRARTLVGPELQTIPVAAEAWYEFETYKKFSLAFYTVLMAYADELQAVSVDEALIDATGAVAARAGAPEEAGVEGKRDPAVEIAEKIRDDVRRETGCEVSIGISHNIMLAKLATRRAKPAGVFHLEAEAVSAFLAALDVEDFPSVGGSIRTKIEEKFGTTIVGELAQHSRGNLRYILGPKTGDMVWGYIRGADERRIEPHKERKSISAEMNYGIRFQTQDQAEICVADLAAEVSKRMKNVGAKGRLLTLKLMRRHPEAPIEPPKFLGHGWCETFNRAAPVLTKGGGSTDDAGILAAEAVKVLRAMKLDPVELRGVGIQITKLDPEKGEREVGQGVLSFGGKKGAKEEGMLADAQQDAKPAQPAPIVAAAQPAAGPSRLPASSEIDPDFLAALPEELKQEVQAEHARTRAAKRAAAQTVLPKPTTTAVRASTRNAAAHISKQLRPKVKTQLKAGQIADLALYSAWNKAENRERERERSDTPMSFIAKGKGRAETPVSVVSADEVVDLTVSPEAPGRGAKRRRSASIDVEVDESGEKVGVYFASDLRGLGIDLEVFGALPADMQKEVVEEERRRVRQRKLLHRPADTSRVKARERESERRAGVRAGSRTVSLSPTRVGTRSRGGSRRTSVPPVSRVQVVRPDAKRPALLGSQSEDEVLGTIERWIESRGEKGPAERDVKKVQGYLERLVGVGQGVRGVELAVGCLHRMRVVLEEKWVPEPEEMEGKRGKARDEWWATWERLRGAVSAGVERVMGAPLRI